jgi:hypothetical protein
LAAEAVFDPFAITPTHPGDISNNPEKYESNDHPLLFYEKIRHQMSY